MSNIFSTSKICVFIFLTILMLNLHPQALLAQPKTNFKFKKLFKLPVDEPMGMTISKNSMWVSDLKTKSIVNVDLKSGKLQRKIKSPGFYPTGLALHEGTLYHCDRRLKTIYKYKTKKQLNKSPIPFYERWAWGMTYYKNFLFIIDARSNHIVKIDLEDGTTVSKFKAPAKHSAGLASNPGYLWVSDYHTDSIYKLDASTGKVIYSLASPTSYPSALAIQDGKLYVSDFASGDLFVADIRRIPTYIEDKPREIKVSYEVNYHVQGSGEIHDLTAYLAIPPKIPGQHLHGKILFDPQPDKIDQDKWGQKVAIFKLGNMKQDQRKKISWSGFFTIYRTRFYLDPDNYKTVYPPAKLQNYLNNGKKLDLDSVYIKTLVKKLIANKTNYYWKARTLYEYLTKVITYERSGGWNNATTVLKRGSGSCSEYTFALIALLRASGIPSRYVGALSERGDKNSFDDVFHRWVEIWFPEAGWVPVDANAGWGKSPAKKGFYFGARTNRHLITTVGGGGSKYIRWTYNHHQTYTTKGNAVLNVYNTGKYRNKQRITSPKDKQISRYIAFSTECPKCKSNLSNKPAIIENETETINQNRNKTCSENKIGMGIFLLFGFFLLGLGIFLGYAFRIRYIETNQ